MRCDGNHHGLTGAYAIGDERNGLGEELIEVVEEVSLVTEPAVGVLVSALASRVKAFRNQLGKPMHANNGRTTAVDIPE